MSDYQQQLRAIDTALTAEKRTAIIGRFVSVNPSQRGAGFRDVLEMLINGDAYCARTDPFLEAHAGEIPAGPLPGPEGGPTVRLYACYAILASGGDLTVEAVTDLLARSEP